MEVVLDYCYQDFLQSKLLVNYRNEIREIVNEIRKIYLLWRENSFETTIVFKLNYQLAGISLQNELFVCTLSQLAGLFSCQIQKNRLQLLQLILLESYLM